MKIHRNGCIRGTSAPDTHFTPPGGKFLSTPEPFARSQRRLERVFAKTAPRAQESRQIRFAIRGLRFRLAVSLRNVRGHCGEGGNARKFPLASKGGNDIFATIVFQPIRLWGVGPAALAVKRGNAAWGRKNRHW